MSHLAGNEHNPDYAATALTISRMVVSKQEAYGDSFGRSHLIIEILYPDGIKKENIQDFLAVVRVIDKLFRIANKKDAFGENPWQDIAGYALLSLVNDQRIGGMDVKKIKEADGVSGIATG